MLVVGGIGSLTGAVFGVLVLSILIEILVRLERGIDVAGNILSIASGTQEILNRYYNDCHADY